MGNFYISKDTIDSTLASEPVQGKKLLEPLKQISLDNQLPMHILEDKEISNEAEVHMDEGDLWHCLEGEVTFHYGGTMEGAENRLKPDGTVNENELKGTGVKDGKTVVLKKGDWLWIPEGEPHQHICEKTARLIIIKVPKRV